MTNTVFSPSFGINSHLVSPAGQRGELTRVMEAVVPVMLAAFRSGEITNLDTRRKRSGPVTWVSPSVNVDGKSAHLVLKRRGERYMATVHTNGKKTSVPVDSLLN